MQDRYTIEQLLGRLNEIEEKHAPKFLYAAGRRELLRKVPRISIIGSRNATPEGLNTARHIAARIAETNGVVVSGLAKGIDTAAHLAAIKASGDTIAVIATPLNRAYPRENEALQNKLKREHLVVTQFPEGTPTTRKNFPMRNRTMALLSHASIIIEATEKSGTQHQGWEALRLGRRLFIPSILTHATFEWPKKMLEYGAIPYENTGDLEELLAYYLPTTQPTNQNSNESTEIRF